MILQGIASKATQDFAKNDKQKGLAMLMIGMQTKLHGYHVGSQVMIYVVA